jgi:rod shape-determining protein MreC
MSPTSPGKRPSRAVLVLLLLASFTLITLDARSTDRSPLDPVRSAVGNVLGPVENGTAAAVRPFKAVPGFFRTTGALRADVARLEAENSQLRGRLAGSSVDRNRAAELDGLLASSKSTGYALVPARVVAMGPAQSFSRTVTIDAGTAAGVHPDMTVLNNDGLVGRVAAVYSTPRQQSTQAFIEPFFDFSSLDLVGVVVRANTKSDRTVIKAGAAEPAESSTEGTR